MAAFFPLIMYGLYKLISPVNINDSIAAVEALLSIKVSSLKSIKIVSLVLLDNLLILSVSFGIVTP